MYKRKYCFCQKTDSGKFMVCCDGCNSWFHGECVGVRKGQILESLKWFCYSCSQKVHDETERRLDLLEKKISDSEKEKRQLFETLQNTQCKLSTALNEYEVLKRDLSELQAEFAKVCQPRAEMEEDSKVLKDNLEIADRRILIADNNLLVLKSQLKELEEEHARVCEANTNLKNENKKLLGIIQTKEGKISTALDDNNILESKLSQLQEQYANACQPKTEMEKENNEEAKESMIVDNGSELKQLEERYAQVCEENETLKEQLLNLKKRSRLSLKKSQQ